MLTPVDLETMVFRRGFRGYKVQEIQEFMGKITNDYERLYRENIELKEEIESLRVNLEKYQAMEETMRNAMILAQGTAEEVKIAAKQQASLIKQDAEQKGERVKAKIKEEIQGEIQKLATLKTQVDFFKSQFKSFLKGLLEIADNQLELNVELEKQIKLNEAQFLNQAAATEAMNPEVPVPPVNFSSTTGSPHGYDVSQIKANVDRVFSRDDN